MALSSPPPPPHPTSSSLTRVDLFLYGAVVYVGREGRRGGGERLWIIREIRRRRQLVARGVPPLHTLQLGQPPRHPLRLEQRLRVFPRPLPGGGLRELREVRDVAADGEHGPHPQVVVGRVAQGPPQRRLVPLDGVPVAAVVVREEELGDDAGEVGRVLGDAGDDLEDGEEAVVEGRVAPLRGDRGVQVGRVQDQEVRVGAPRELRHGVGDDEVGARGEEVVVVFVGGRGGGGAEDVGPAGCYFFAVGVLVM